MSDPNMYRQQWAAPVTHPPAAVQPYRPGHLVPGAMANGHLVSAGGRLGALLLDGLLMMVTLWIGWLVWSMFTWSDGQTPGKKLLGHVVADAQTGQPFDWGRMAVREFCVKGLLGWFLDVVTLSVYFWIDAFTVFGDRQRTLHDRMAGSIVRHL
ncbi:RDD family protein [Actinoplanes sp. CA-131856]